MSCQRKTYYIDQQAAQALRRDGLGWMISPNDRIEGPCNPTLLDRIKGLRK